MREKGISLTNAGRCTNPTCGREVFAELQREQAPRLCADCEETGAAEALRRRMVHCSEACCRKKAA